MTRQLRIENRLVALAPLKKLDSVTLVLPQNLVQTRSIPLNSTMIMKTTKKLKKFVAAVDVGAGEANPANVPNQWGALIRCCQQPMMPFR